VNISEYIKNITQEVQSSGLKLDSNNNYDIKNRKLTNVAAGTDLSDAVTKQQLDSIGQGTTTKDIDLDNKYIVKDSKTRARSELNSALQSLINLKKEEKTL